MLTRGLLVHGETTRRKILDHRFIARPKDVIVPPYVDTDLCDFRIACPMRESTLALADNATLD